MPRRGETTSERKNRKRLRALLALRDSDPERFSRERERLRRIWTAEVWRRVGRRDLPPAGELIRTASLFGLGAEIADEVVRAVRDILAGPDFNSRSVTIPRSSAPDDVASWCEHFTARVPRGRRRGEEQT